MQLNHGLLVVLSLALTSVTAHPASLPSLKGRSFSVERHHNKNHVRNGRAALQRALTKYGFSLPDVLDGTLAQWLTNPTTVSDAPQPTSTGDNGDVAATPEENDAEYLAPVTIGGQKLNLDFDTGSSDLWIFNTQLSSQQTAGHSTFDPSKSSTFKKMNGATFQIQYGDQSSVSGNVGTDTVEIGGASVEKQAVELATQLSGSFEQDTNNDGLLGLAFSSINTVSPKQQKTFFDNVMDSLDEPVFTAALKHATPGTYDFGTIDDSKFTGDIAYTSIDNSQGLWQFQPQGMSVNGKSVGQNLPSIADTGTSLLLVDDDTVEAYYDQVQGAQLDTSQGGYTFPCDADLPDLDLAITDSYTATIPGSVLNFAPVDGQSEYYTNINTNTTNCTSSSHPSSSSSSRRSSVAAGSSPPYVNNTCSPTFVPACFGGLQTSGGEPFNILGDPLFKAQFVVFDAGKIQIGFADHS
ncbi:MAG: hypothetical protein M4579_006442 [Chaenotheca gracillima]|nr:MAG: hypothetical protein M4579_006442 [Chaenotheca gracillima]